jgi:methionine synthase I (cobalamin-dependent)
VYFAAEPNMAYLDDEVKLVYFSDTDQSFENEVRGFITDDWGNAANGCCCVGNGNHFDCVGSNHYY